MSNRIQTVYWTILLASLQPIKNSFNNQVSETSVLGRGIHSGFYLLEKELT